MIILIDWLDFAVPFAHVPIAQGACLIVEHDGSVRRETAIRRRVTGSYDASIGVESVTPSSLTRKQLDTLPHFVLHALVAAAPPLGHCSHLAFSGNPVKFLQGHNVFGPSCLRTLAVRLVEDVLPRLGFDELAIARVRQRVHALDFTVSRIDLTGMFALGSDEDVQNYLYMLPHVAKVRGDNVECCKSTFYVQKHSTWWSAKLYNKCRELARHPLPEALRGSGIDEFAKGQLRLEFVFRKKLLERLGLLSAKALQAQLDRLFIDYAEKIAMHNQTVDEKRLLTLSNTYQGTYKLWFAGYRMDTVLSRSTYYRHRRALLPYGIDIAKPPIAAEQRKVSIAPIVKHLVPRRVTEIPAHLQRFLLREVA